MTFGTLRHLKSRTKRRLFALALSFMPFVQQPSLGAPQETGPLTIESLVATLMVHSQRSVRFHESRHIAALISPLESEGVLTFTPPSGLLKEVTTPRAISYRVEGDQVFIHDPRATEDMAFSLADAGVLQAFIEAIRAPLAGDLVTLRKFWEPHLGGSLLHWSLTLKPKGPELSALVLQVTVNGERGTVTAISIVQSDGDSSHLRFTPK